MSLLPPTLKTYPRREKSAILQKSGSSNANLPALQMIIADSTFYDLIAFQNVADVKLVEQPGHD